MAGDWFPVTVGIERRREVVSIAANTGRTREEVVGLLVSFWGWVTLETRERSVNGVTIRALPALVGGDTEFWTAVANAGWLEETEAGIAIPNFDRWFSNSAKTRLQQSLRQRRRRECHGDEAEMKREMSRDSRVKRATRVDEMREEDDDDGRPAADEPRPTTAPPHPDLLNLDLWRDNKRLNAEWPRLKRLGAEAYPALDMVAELRAAHLWLVARPKEQRRDIVRYLGNWFKRAQDDPKLRAKPAAQAGQDSTSGVSNEAKAMAARLKALEAEDAAGKGCR